MKSSNVRRAILVLTHLAAVGAGFAIGIYALPILTAPPAAATAAVQDIQSRAQYRGSFRRDLKDSDLLHWGEGVVTVSAESIALSGELAPGPDYKLYLSPEFVETESDFKRLKPQMVRVGDVRTFKNFVVAVPAGINPSRFKAVIVWCETFGQFITAARYD